MTNNKIEIIINGNKISAESGQSVLEIARKNNIDIPALCYHPDLEVKSNCRLCLVTVKGKEGLYTSCSLKAEDGMEIITESPEIFRTVKTNLELLFAQHCEECTDCIWNFNCYFLELAKKYNVKIARFDDRKKDWPVYQFGPALQFDSSKCIDCRNCVEVCHKQGIDFLEVKEKNGLKQILPTSDKNKDCIYCGQCIVHCPVGAFEAIGEFEEVEEPLLDKSKKVVFQFAPSIRSSIGEEFGLPHGSVVTDQLAGAIKQLGVDRVFDVSVGADFTTYEEANELAERIEKNKHLPMFTSCCPAWVKYVEFNRPELIPHLTTVRSPHIISGGLIKTYWAEMEKIDTKDIVVVSVMPCVSKKYEITRDELNIDGLKPVDYVFTTRELAYLLHKRKIDLAKAVPSPPDSVLGIPSGAGVIYGSSGGVMESALRTAYEKMTGNKLENIEFNEVRGMQGVKKAEVKIGDRKVKVAVANGMENAIKILAELEKNPNAYDYIEVMACPGGCIGGGGQPVPANEEIRKKRSASLYDLDVANKIRLAHESPIVKKVYDEYLINQERIQKISYTTFKRKKKEVIIN